ncbi:DALR anticodon-binding domain-containing protein 3 [Euwallacea fornicatus]|uniref:DALR anticodon-binding domain-containing protein 3 n=1 Tax=Euwallacea fornicatus TaxID=995702 RepID=UPI00338E9227
MNPLTHYIETIYNILLGYTPNEEETLIKMHTRYLEELGDMSFPIPLKNWYHFTKKPQNSECETIFQYKLKENDVDDALQQLVKHLNVVLLNVCCFKTIKNSAHLFLERPILFHEGIQKVLNSNSTYGQYHLFKRNIKLIIANSAYLSKNHNIMDLTTLRLLIIKETIERLLTLTTNCDSKDFIEVTISQNNNTKPTIVCGPVLNELGIKDLEHKAIDFFNKRIVDMRLMAQHRYRVNMKSPCDWNELFSKLGIASVTIELLSNKPHKSAKVDLNDLSSANKGPSFIFYNCARLSILLKEFESKVDKGIYQELPKVHKIDFALLKQPEEWELLYVYILQFPHVIKSCIKGVEKGNVNPQHLITFLSSLSSVFSVYYRRVRILTEPRDHMFNLIHARIYLLRGVQVVFHNALKLLNINPVKEM